jgi:hypothetical protein
MADVTDAKTRPLAERSTVELVQHATEQLTRLIRDELALARVELVEKGRHAGVGIGLFGGAAVVALAGLAVLIAAVVLALALVLPAWAAALIVAVMLLLTAGVLALIGRGQIARAVPPIPSGMAQRLRADIETVTAAVRHRGRA